MKKQVKICQECGGEMYQSGVGRAFRVNGKVVVINGIQGFVCEHCHLVLYSSEDAQKIKEMIQAAK